ncbi:MAG: class I SAM-dependent methyltransferase, partial [Alphaproteobacteria bacterium]|nr:class I SAM-dependent methyltransferase [Alphaproteobacteria bacterium]
LREATSALEFAGMQISPMQGHFMQMLVRLTGARRIIEVGTFTGYSTLCMALALPEDGELVALDVSQEWTAIGRRHWARAGVDGKIDLRLAPAVESLDGLIADGRAGQFDLAFIDADKSGYPDYWERALVLLRPGGAIAADNALFSGRVLPDVSDDELLAARAHLPEERQQSALAAVHALRRFNETIRHDDRVDHAMTPIGDGITLAVKR